jgi:hypothetical protein
MYIATQYVTFSSSFYFFILKYCNGNTFFLICSVGGLKCPELDRFLNRLEHADLFASCLEKEGWQTIEARIKMKKNYLI